MNYVALVVSLLFVATLTSCKKDAIVEETQEEIFLSNISKTWTTSSVRVDGKDVSASFPGLKITISDDKRITVVNAVPPIWNGSGTFELLPVGNSYQLKRDDGVVMTLTQPATNNLILRFQYDPSKLGRVSSVVGEFVFEFSGS